MPKPAIPSRPILDLGVGESGLEAKLLEDRGPGLLAEAIPGVY